MAWRKTPDGSFEDESGRVLFFSKARFVNDICLGHCCFICGAPPGSKLFNDEHVIPDWVLRRFGLFDQDLTLPNDRTIKYRNYKVPCCADCNALMGREIEERISKVVSAGSDAMQDYIRNGNSLYLFVWLGLIFLKTHLKDRDYRMHLDRRMADTKIGDLYDWETLHHLHCVVRCFVNGARFDKEVIGSLAVFPAKSEGSNETFDYGDLFPAQTMMIRLGDVAIVATFNDAAAAIQGTMPRLRRIDGPLSEVQLREVMVDFAFINLSLKERPKFHTECDMVNRTLTEKVELPKLFQLDELDYSLRGELFRYAYRDILNQMRFAGKSPAEISTAIESGRLSFLFDDQGKFIVNGFVAEPTITT